MDVVLATMDSASWSDLPWDLVEIILRALPVRSLVRFRTVCKKWNEIILSKSFLCTRRSQRICGPSINAKLFTFLEEEDRAFRIYDSTAKRWYTHSISLSNILPVTKIRVKASAGGLVCGIIEHSSEGFKYFVCNPVLKNWKLLPPVQVKTISAPLMDMVIDRSNCTETQYKIIVIGSGYRGRVWISRGMAIFDSSTEEWALFDVPANPRRSLYSNKSTICNGILYLCSDYGYFDGIHFFDIQNQSWDPLELYSSTRSIRVRIRGSLDGMYTKLPQVLFPIIVESEGRLLLVGLPLHDNHNVDIVGPTVWALEVRDCKAVWQEISCMPPKMFKSSMIRGGWPRCWCDFDVVAHGDTICFSTYTNPTNILAFDVSKNLWYTLAGNLQDSLSDNNCLIDGCKILKAHQFQPSLEDFVD